jgi:hypothetical protein
MDCYSHGKPVSIQRPWVCLSVSVSYAAVISAAKVQKKYGLYKKLGGKVIDFYILQAK